MWPEDKSVDELVRERGLQKVPEEKVNRRVPNPPGTSERPVELRREPGIVDLLDEWENRKEKFTGGLLKILRLEAPLEEIRLPESEDKSEGKDGGSD